MIPFNLNLHEAIEHTNNLNFLVPSVMKTTNKVLHIMLALHSEKNNVIFSCKQQLLLRLLFIYK